MSTYHNPKYLNINDPICRRIGKFVLEEQQAGLIVKEHPNEYDIDLEIYNESVLWGYLEVEYAERSRFYGKDYKSQKEHGVSVPIRKNRYHYYNKPWFWMNISADYTHFILMSGDFIKKHGHESTYHVCNNPDEETFVIVPEALSFPKITRISKGVLEKVYGIKL